MLFLYVMELIIFMLIYLLFKTQSYIQVLMQFFILIVLLSTGLLLIHVEFLAFMLLLIYAGAVLILFLFVIMLFDGNILNINKNVKLIKYFFVGQLIIWLLIINYVSVDYDMGTVNEDLFFMEQVFNNFSFTGDKYFFGFFKDYKVIEFYVNDFDFVDKKYVKFQFNPEQQESFYVQYEDMTLFKEVGIYLFNYCTFEFFLIGLLIFICLVSIGKILKIK